MVRSASASTWKHRWPRGRRSKLVARWRGRFDAVEHHVVDPEAVPGGGQREPAIVDRERVEALAAVDPDAVDLERRANANVSPPKVTSIRPAREVSDLVLIRAAGDDQRAALDPHRQRTGDELAPPVRRRGALEVAADAPRERARERRVLQRRHEQQVPALCHRPAGQPLARLGVGQQPVAKRRGGDARHVELDRVDRAIPRGQAMEAEHRLLAEARADGVGDRVQLVRANVIDVEGRERSNVVTPSKENTPMSSSESPRARLRRR